MKESHDALGVSKDVVAEKLSKIAYDIFHFDKDVKVSELAERLSNDLEDKEILILATQQVYSTLQEYVAFMAENFINHLKKNN